MITSNVEDMSYMFYGCESLYSLPNISFWNTNKVLDMSYIFGYCYSLVSLPDISKWKTGNVNQMKYIFKSCTSLSFLPDISKWNIPRVFDREFEYDIPLFLRERIDYKVSNVFKVYKVKGVLDECINLIINNKKNKI